MGERGGVGEETGERMGEGGREMGAEGEETGERRGREGSDMGTHTCKYMHNVTMH